MAYPTAPAANPSIGTTADPSIGTTAYPKPGTLADVPTKQLTEAEQEQLDTLYAQLKPEATASARAYVLNRTPVALQEDMKAKIDADFPPPVQADAEAAKKPTKVEANA